MALNAKVERVEVGGQGTQVNVNAGISAWETVIDAGGIANQDAALITNPDADITSGATHLFRRADGAGTTLLVQLAYDRDLSGITSPTINVFGRVVDDEGEPVTGWERLSNLEGDHDITLSSASDDVSDGMLKSTTVSLTEHALDCRNCNEFVIGVTEALAGTGSVDNAVVRVKLI